jgi:hypothetical protein
VQTVIAANARMAGKAVIFIFLPLILTMKCGQ